MVSAAFGLYGYGATEFTRHHEENLLIEAASLEVVEKGGDSMIHLGTKHASASHDPGMLAVAVVVPTCHAHGDETATSLHQAPGHEHAMAESGGTL